MTIWSIYVKSSPLRIWSNLLARMFRHEPRSFSGLVNSGGVSTMRTGPAHERLLVVMGTNKEAADKIVRTERRVTSREIQESRSIGMAATMSILHDHLRVRKRCAGWIPHSLTNEQGRARCQWSSSRCESSMEAVQNWPGKCWQVTKHGSIDMILKPRCSQRFGCFYTSPHPKNFQKSRKAQKKMVACFFGKSSHLATILLEGRQAVTKEWYVHHCLPKVFVVCFQRRPKTGLHGLCLHRDNASAHTAVRRLTFSMRARCSCCTHRIRQTSLLATSSYSRKWRNNWRAPEGSAEHACRAYTRAVEDKPKSTWAVKSGASGVTAWQSRPT